MSTPITDGQLMRLDAVADHLDIRVDAEDEGFNEAVISTCLTKVAPIIAEASATTGEEILAALGTTSLSVLRKFGRKLILRGWNKST